MFENGVVFDKQAIPADIQSVIDLYKSFSKYDEYTHEELYHHVLPSFELEQCKLFKENNKVIAFANWAFLNYKTEKEYINTGDFSNKDWNSGNNTWVIDVVSIKDGDKIGKWLKNKFKQFKWMRSDKNFNFYRIGSRGY